MLGALPLVGRSLQPDDHRADVVVLSERLWRTRFGSAPSIVGSTVTIDGTAREVIGVMPRAFRGWPAGLTRDVWLPVDADGAHRGLATDRGAARLKPTTA